VPSSGMRFPEDGTPVSKHVGGDTNGELYYMFCILLYFLSTLLVDIWL